MASYLKVLKVLAWEVNSDKGGQLKHGLWGSNVKTGRYLPGDSRGKFLVLFLGLKVIMLFRVNLFFFKLVNMIPWIIKGTK